MRRMIDRAFDGISRSRILTQEVVNAITFPHLVDIYKPQTLSVDASKEAAAVNWVKAYSLVRCMLVATPESDEPRTQGRMKVQNIFTNDHYYFPTAILIDDTYAIHMRSGASLLPDYVGAWWLVQGNPQSQEGFAFQLSAVQLVYAKLSPQPANLTL